jgi:uncharacterized protein
MIYLLDVNALLALGFREHEFHARTALWVAALPSETELATCAITELGFVRVLAQAPQYQISIEQSCALLGKLKASRKRPFRFLANNLGVDRLPKWAKGGRQITDAHLAELAREHGGRLATLDAKIPHAFLIPERKLPRS